MPSQGLPCPSLPGRRVTVGPFVTSLCDSPLRCMWSARLRPPARSVRQDGDGKGQERGTGEEPLSAAHVFPRRPRQPRNAKAFRQSFPLPHPYPFAPSRRMAERPPRHPRVAWEARAPQESSPPLKPYQVCMVQPLQTGE